MKIVDARMAALAVAGLWMPNPAVIQWMIVGGEITAQILEEIEAAMFDAFGRTDRSANASADDLDAARKFAILAAAEAARFWGGYAPSVRYASLAYGMSKSPYVADDLVSQQLREQFAEEFAVMIVASSS